MGDWLIIAHPLSPWLILACYLFNALAFAALTVFIKEKWTVGRILLRVFVSITYMFYTTLFVWQLINIVKGDLNNFMNGEEFINLPVTLILIVLLPVGGYLYRKTISKKLSEWFPKTYIRLRAWLNRRLVKTLRQQTKKLGFDDDALEACKNAIKTFGLDRDNQDALKTFLNEARERLKLMKKARKNDDPMNHYVEPNPPYSYTPRYPSKANEAQRNLSFLLSGKKERLSGGVEMNDKLQYKLESWFIRNTETVCGVQLPRTEEDLLRMGHEKHEEALQTQFTQTQTAQAR